MGRKKVTDKNMEQVAKPFPKPLPLVKLLGPSFIILALGLGSGEVILWPYLTANYGLGLAWGALIGITFQYFINMEIERYALIRGESVFVGIAKIFPGAPFWFIISTFAGFGLPGIVAASAQVLASLAGIDEFRWIAVGMLIAIGIVLSVGKTVYGMMEAVTKTIIFFGIPFIILLALLLSDMADWQALAAGMIGQGQSFWLLPAGISLATFFGAFAYSGAGGNLNLTQSIYIKEKGYGMGAYAQKIAGLFHNLSGNQRIKLEGEHFDLTPENIKNFRSWWRRVSVEHALVFWLTGFLGISVLMMLAYVTAFGAPGNASGIHFVINEGAVIGSRLGAVIGTTFLFVVAIMLFQTQLGILDSTSRIMAENTAIKKIASATDGGKHINLSHIYFGFLWAQIIFGIILFAFNIAEPRLLITLGAVLNAISMFVHIGLVNWTNKKLLPTPLQPGLARRILIIFIFIFFGGFSTLIVWDSITKLLN